MSCTGTSTNPVLVLLLVLVLVLVRVFILVLYSCWYWDIRALVVKQQYFACTNPRVLLQSVQSFLKIV